MFIETAIFFVRVCWVLISLGRFQRLRKIKVVERHFMCLVVSRVIGSKFCNEIILVV